MSEDMQTMEFPDALAANEHYQHEGWSDGLPVVPPTPELVAECLHRADLRPDDIVGIEPVRSRKITAQLVATNAVMAGCLPSYFPVVVAAIDAMCGEEFLLHGCTSSTGGAAPLLVVNGPVRSEIGMNATHNVLANGSRANASIGRAVRLTLINVLGLIPGGLDRATLGHPGKFTMCVAEDEEDSPWVALSEERGAGPSSDCSAVTVMACTSPHQVLNEWTHDPEEILETFAAAMRANMLTYSIWSGNYALIIPKQLRDLIASAGWSKDDIKRFIHSRARVKRGDWRAVGKANVVAADRHDEVQTALGKPEDLLVVAAGGPAGGFGAIVPPWLGSRSTAVTRAIRHSE